MVTSRFFKFAGNRPRLPYTLIASLSVMTLLVVIAATLVLLGHTAAPANPVIVAVTAPSALPGVPLNAAPAASAGTAAAAAPAAASPTPLTPAATASLSSPPSPTSHSLAAAPDPGLITRGTYGFVPTVGKDGRRPWKVYARAFDATDKRPRIAMIIVGLGVSASATDAAIRDAPGSVTLAFAPFARRLGQWMNLARANGHETLVELPMEPIDYPRQDPGFNALLTALTPAQNIDRLGWVMAQGSGYTGLIGRLGGRFSAQNDAMKPVLEEIGKHGLLYIDNRATPQSVVSHLAPSIDLPVAGINRYIDSDPSPGEIDRNLADLEELAKHSGSAIGAANAGTVTLTKLSAWANGLEARGIALAPVSAVVPPPEHDNDTAP